MIEEMLRALKIQTSKLSLIFTKHPVSIFPSRSKKNCKWNGRTFCHGISVRPPKRIEIIFLPSLVLAYAQRFWRFSQIIRNFIFPFLHFPTRIYHFRGKPPDLLGQESTPRLWTLRNFEYFSISVHKTNSSNSIMIQSYFTLIISSAQARRSTEKCLSGRL